MNTKGMVEPPAVFLISDERLEQLAGQAQVLANEYRVLRGQFQALLRCAADNGVPSDVLKEALFHA